VSTGKKVDSRRAYSHTHARLKRVGMGTNGILECKAIRSKTERCANHTPMRLTLTLTRQNPWSKPSTMLSGLSKVLHVRVDDDISHFPNQVLWQPAVL
jgi:hypothetical protein